MSHQECTNGRSPDAFREDVRTWPSQRARSEEHTSELQSPCNLVCRLLLEKISVRPFEARELRGIGKLAVGEAVDEGLRAKLCAEFFERLREPSLDRLAQLGRILSALLDAL